MQLCSFTFMNVANKYLNYLPAVCFKLEAILCESVVE